MYPISRKCIYDMNYLYSRFVPFDFTFEYFVTIES